MFKKYIYKQTAFDAVSLFTGICFGYGCNVFLHKFTAIPIRFSRDNTGYKNPNKEKDKAFDSFILDPSHPQIVELIKTGYDGLEFMKEKEG